MVQAKVEHPKACEKVEVDETVLQPEPRVASPGTKRTRLICGLLYSLREDIFSVDFMLASKSKLYHEAAFSIA